MFGWLLVMPFIILAVVAWSLVWKGLALWRAGRKNQLGWFIALLLINTMGILEIVYLLTAGKNEVAPTDNQNK
ncbi:MAG: hypothetical protein A2261_02200 [Candidatus Magasanikbacteria bacterium RIFOXYA2_FULL_44_8]|uniref:DUF5652 domain-containing protein n=1 Tax=Candidatus Magasanikbacteria bacterium RIFOXYA2_FULL_44_8 TaxID=1798696 RepID=A0A1F6NKL7_9BACT|nr:MAG: hypothetical protein A2261_02200 [Candidatus Magasanikbacteria bacterium RIFOXYA2_FULL_44_8]